MNRLFVQSLIHLYIIIFSCFIAVLNITHAATSSADFDSFMMEVTIASIAGSSASCVNENITLFDDTLVEGNETFTVTLSNVASCGANCAEIGTQDTATVTIVDNDAGK